MALDAFVSCRCWERGLCSVPPEEFASLLYLDEAERTLRWRARYEDEPYKQGQLDRTIHQWKKDQACAHRDMLVARERVANRAGLSLFRAALRSRGADRYATLLNEIPEENDGITSPEVAAVCLTELEEFVQSGAHGCRVELVDVTRGPVVQTRVPPFDGWFAGTGPTSFRLIEDGTLRIEHRPQEDSPATVVFQAARITQQRVGPDQFRFTDAATGRQVTCGIGVTDPDGTGHVPSLLAVRQVSDDPGQYAYCLEPLRRLFQASVETGNPVVWT